MELFEGFIVGISNYCDRWCETCEFTSRCRLFADLARYDAERDPAMKAVVHAPTLPRHGPAPLPRWMQELLDRIDEEVDKMAPAKLARDPLPSIGPAHREIYERAGAYSEWVRKWLREQGCAADRTLRAEDPVAVISWFAPLNSSKIYRALTGLAEFGGDRELPPDHEGSAKVALLGLERSQAAWRQLVDSGGVTDTLAAYCVAELGWIRDRLDEVIPEARAFVRPGFDEPESVARLGPR
jgi:hypothetical protein